MNEPTAEAMGEAWLSLTNEQRSELLSQRREHQLIENVRRKSDMPKRHSTARGREFGEGMRAAIAGSGMSSRQLADLLGWQEAKVSDMVNGKGGVTAHEVAVALGACRIPQVEREHLLDLFPTTEVSGWWQPHGKCAPIRSRTAQAHLAAADTMVSWNPHTIPDLLRTNGYAHQLLTASANVAPNEIDARLLALSEMQQSLGGGLSCAFYLHEFALDLQVGGRQVHIAQLQHLMRMASWAKVRVLVVPAEVGAHAGIAGPFTHLAFPRYRSLVWITTENSSLFVEEEQAVKGYEAIIRALDDVSLDDDESLKWISRRYVRLLEHDGSDEVVHENDSFPPL